MLVNTRLRAFRAARNVNCQGLNCKMVEVRGIEPLSERVHCEGPSSSKTPLHPQRVGRGLAVQHGIPSPTFSHRLHAFFYFGLCVAERNSIRQSRRVGRDLTPKEYVPLPDITQLAPCVALWAAVAPKCLPEPKSSVGSKRRRDL